jgi:phage/plasmid primase-like uncharacterized protein
MEISVLTRHGNKYVMTAFDEWVDRAKAVRIEDEAARRDMRLRRTGAELVGPCPRCGGDDRFWINTKRQTWGCRQCGGNGDRVKGGDVIELVRHIDGCDFRSACETLTGAGLYLRGREMR